MTYSGSSGRITNYFEISHNPISDATGNIIGVSIFSKDITERTLTENKIKELNKSLEQRVSERTHQLESINRELSFRLNEIEQFTYIASHDLQEPLRSLTSFTQLVHDEYAEKLGGDGDKYIEFIYSSANRMRELVTGLLNYSLLGKEGVKVIVDCNQVVKEVIADMSDLINANKAMITVAELPGLNGFATELRLLFQNLIHNAIKFQRKGICPQINISAVFEKNEWLFSVADNGIGIDDINREKIFIIFKRMHNRDEYEGAGIGLSHCKKIVELHGGQIWVDSNKDAGSIFRFTIPV
jgi:light-regulated signal transduction histidine kinase (bacteriophytochrome)